MDPDHVSARMGLGTLLLNQRRLAAAEEQFRAVLAVEPESTQALLGLSYVQTLRGGEELEPAEKALRALLARSPANARAHYLLGLIQERRDQPAEAAASFKRASELLLERTDQE
jgi:cytochrome c-type biogenesis protein CcmH/NrfG